VNRRLAWALAVIATVVVVTTPYAARAPATITVEGTAFHVDGRPTFLLGISLFDALGTPPRDRDLDALDGWGVRIIRVWAHWHEAIYQGDGALTAPGRARLLALTGRLRARGMILELVLLKPGHLPGQASAIFTSPAARVRAIEAMTSALRDYRNVIFDIYNEHDHPGGPISHADARVLRDAVKAIDPDRLVTISSTGGHLVSAASQVGPGEERNLREEAGTGPGAVAVDIVAPHFPRTDDWAAATGTRIAAVKSVLGKMGRSLPIYLNEERRSDDRVALDPAAYRDAFTKAREAGAAAWLFHTDAGFYLAKTPFLDALAPNERAALQSLR
jgi:hypothetical protein